MAMLKANLASRRLKRLNTIVSATWKAAQNIISMESACDAKKEEVSFGRCCSSGAAAEQKTAATEGKDLRTAGRPIVVVTGANLRVDGHWNQPGSRSHQGWRARSASQRREYRDPAERY